MGTQMNALNALAYGLMIVWWAWRSSYTWKAWRKGHLNPKNVLFLGVGWVGIIGLGVRYF